VVHDQAVRRWGRRFQLRPVEIKDIIAGRDLAGVEPIFQIGKWSAPVAARMGRPEALDFSLAFLPLHLEFQSIAIKTMVPTKRIESRRM
jgi:hypothetical protein